MHRNSRVNKYQATTYNKTTGAIVTCLYDFTEAQAKECGTILHPDGINIISAINLCERWSRLGRLGSSNIIYSYSIPFCKSLKY